MLQNAYLVAKIGADTAENEQHLAEISPIGRRVADHGPTTRRTGAAGTSASTWGAARRPRSGPRLGLALSWDGFLSELSISNLTQI